MNKLLMIFLFMVLSFSLVYTETDENLKKKIIKSSAPSWIKDFKAPDGYYAGKGIGQSLQDSYLSAINVIGSQIKAKVQSETQSKIDMISKNNEKILSEEFKRNIILNVNVELEDIEIAQIWYNTKTKEYYTYCKLEIKKYEEKQRKKIEEIKSSVFDLFLKAENSDSPSLAIKFYYLALLKISPYLQTTFEIDYQGSKINLVNEIISKLQNKINTINYQILPDKIIAEKMSTNPTLIKTIVFSDNKPLTTFPIVFTDKSMSFQMNESTTTDSDGIANCSITKVLKNSTAGIISVKLDISTLLKDSIEKNETLVNIASILNLGVPAKDIVINVKMPVFKLEKLNILGDIIGNQDYIQKVSSLENIIKNSLMKSSGVNFIDDGVNFDYLLRNQISCNLTTSESGFYYAKLIITTSIYNKKSGMEVYTDSSKEIKGGSTSFLKAIQTSCDLFNKEQSDEYTNKIINFFNDETKP